MENLFSLTIKLCDKCKNRKTTNIMYNIRFKQPPAMKQNNIFTQWFLAQRQLRDHYMETQSVCCFPDGKKCIGKNTLSDKLKNVAILYNNIILRALMLIYSLSTVHVRY